ncbi:MAG: hypothetical protein P1V97_13915 [Planctomycetota bacterium]|nr:hypothetical protein [Planctomycetota bacterium]
MNSRYTFFCLLFMLTLTACQTTPAKRVDENKTENVTIGFGRTDIQEIVATSYKNFVESNQSTWKPAPKGKPIICIGKVRNQTDEHVDTKMVTDLLRDKLLNSGQVQFTVEKAERATVVDETETQDESGAFEKGAKASNQLTKPQYILNGRFSSIRKKNNDVEELYYAFILKLVHIRKGTISWQSITRIAKVKTRATAGW